MKFKDIPIGQPFHFCNDPLDRDYIKVTKDMAELDDIRVKVTPDTYIQQWFIVFDPTLNVYVEAIYFDVEIIMTPSRAMARIFRGSAWEEYWKNRGCTLEIVPKAGVTQ